MAHYAFLDENNIVTEVIVGINENELIEGLTPEIWYQNFRNQKCIRTSYNTLRNNHLTGGIPFRGNYAGIGFYYDDENDIFIRPKPFESWILNLQICDWIAPVEYPQDDKDYYWDENAQNWIAVE